MFHDIDEWLDYILLETAPMTLQMTQLSNIDLTPQPTNISSNKRLPSKMLQNCRISSNYHVKACQNSPSKIIVKRTKRPSRLGRLLCQENKRDNDFQHWLDKMVFSHPVAWNFDESPISNKKEDNTKLRLSVRLYRRPDKSAVQPSNDVTWKELDRRICTRSRNIDDDPYDGNTKNTLMKVLKTQDLKLLNHGLASDLLAVYLSLLSI